MFSGAPFYHEHSAFPETSSSPPTLGAAEQGANCESPQPHRSGKTKGFLEKARPESQGDVVTVAGIHIFGTAAAASISWPWPEQGFTQTHPSLLQCVKQRVSRGQKLVLLLHCCREPGMSWGPFPGSVIPVPGAVMESEELHKPHTAFTRSTCSGLHSSSPVLSLSPGGCADPGVVSFGEQGCLARTLANRVGNDSRRRRYLLVAGLGRSGC